MLRKLVSLTVAAAVAALLAGGLGGTARADIVLPDFCKTAVPHATLTLGQFPKSVLSNGADYFYNPHQGCYRFIVDVKVAPTGGQQFEIDGTYAGPATGPYTFGANPIALSPSDCPLYSQHVALYEKSWFSLFQTPEFHLVSSGWWKGQWTPGYPALSIPDHCELVLSSGSAPPPLYTGSAVGATYRMVVGVKTTDWQRVRVHADYVPQI